MVFSCPGSSEGCCQCTLPETSILLAVNKINWIHCPCTTVCQCQLKSNEKIYNYILTYPEINQNQCINVLHSSEAAGLYQQAAAALSLSLGALPSWGGGTVSSIRTFSWISSTNTATQTQILHKRWRSENMSSYRSRRCAFYKILQNWLLLQNSPREFFFFKLGFYFSSSLSLSLPPLHIHKLCVELQLDRAR